MRLVHVLSASLLAAALTLPFAAAAEANVVVSIDKSNQQMTVSVDGAQRYVWPVSTGRPGYDTPNGTFRPNRMDADHFSQEWDNAPMPHSIFFDLDGHAVHGFFDVKHLGMAVSHGCVRLSPANAAVLFDLVKTEGMANTSVVVSGRTPGGNNVPVARAHLPVNETAYSAQPQQQSQPMQIAPGYGQPQAPYDDQASYGQSPSGFPPQPPPPTYGQQNYQSYGGQPYGGQTYAGQTYNRQPYGGGQSYYGGPAYQQQPQSYYRPYSPY